MLKVFQAWTSITVLLAAGACSSPEPPLAREARQPDPVEAEIETDDRPVILAFGDSLTAGYGLPPGSGYPELVQEELDRNGYRYRVVNAGISGDTTGGGLGRLSQVLELKPEIVILELGANDGLQGLPTAVTRSNLDELITAFRSEGSSVILAGMTLPRNFGPDYIAAFESVFTELARKHNVTLIPFFLDGVAGQPGLVLEDGIHPNQSGYRSLTATVMKYLTPLLRK